jgi:hypothetical protein
MRIAPIALIALASVAALLPVQPAAAAGVTIYRCVDASGHVALRDTPCVEGERQEVRNMQRPQDPPPPATAEVVQARQPVYDSVSSSSRGGRAQWVPVAPATQSETAQSTGTWVNGTWVQGSWVQGSWTDR